jgi:exodeoxyribonuclease-1
MLLPSTCSVGYNSIRFDDEFTRFTLYRNFYDAYEREYRNGNSRWDLIDVVRLCCALRPEGIEWPKHDTGLPSFKLEMLTAANGLSHEAAHDALSDVTATIALAKLLRERKPRLVDYALKLRRKQFVSTVLNLRQAEPLLHVSSKLPSEFYCTTLVLPVAGHPNNSNGVVCVDLRHDPSPLFELSAGEISRLMYLPRDQRTEQDPHIPLKTIHINRCPIVGTRKLMDAAAAERVQLDLAQCERHAAMLRKETRWLDKLRDVLALPELKEKPDPETALYSGGFFSDEDRNLMRALRQSNPEEIAERTWYFEDDRLREMLFQYRARNYHHTLNAEEQAQWQEHCAQRLHAALPDYQPALEALSDGEIKAQLNANLQAQRVRFSV